MHSILRLILMAYRPLYLHGLLLDGQYRLPKTDQQPGPATSAYRPHHLFHHRSKA